MPCSENSRVNILVSLVNVVRAAFIGWRDYRHADLSVRLGGQESVDMGAQPRLNNESFRDTYSCLWHVD
ncbi:hypothetical protein SODG_004445 [Sodalis praecaptivus]|nr:hypothetical protein NVIRENTERO_03608 [Sodalis praecaptivus]